MTAKALAERVMPPAQPDSWARGADHVLAAFDSRATGLSESDAAVRLARVGPNQLQAVSRAPAWTVLVAQLRSVVAWLLIAAVVLALSTGDRVEALAIAAVLAINTALGFVTELRARRAMEALLRMEAPHAVVVRNGAELTIDARALVPGDIIAVAPGDSVPADARLIGATELRVNEAALTGESVPVSKRAEVVLPPDAPLPDRANMVYKGTTVAAGRARAVVVGTGMATELGRVGGLVASIGTEETPLERRLDALGRRLIVVTIAVAVIVTGLGMLRGEPARGLIVTGIALAIAAVPEGLPAVATIALAIGLRRMARRRALVRRLPAVETLGSVTVICTDKTGTLTVGEMTATTLWVAGRRIDVSGGGYAPLGTFTENGRELDPLKSSSGALAIRTALLASRAQIIRADDGWRSVGDPTDAALVVMARKAGVDRDALLKESRELAELPFTSARSLMASFHEGRAQIFAHVKGAPGRVLDLCDQWLTDRGPAPLDDESRDMLLERNSELAARGLRVLALAHGPVSSCDESALRDLTFVGFVGITDPLAEGVRETVGQFRDAGIKTVMITGDQRPTAQAIAGELGVPATGAQVIDGYELARLSDEELTARARDVTVFSRVSPEHKLRIVEALQRSGEIVAMLGDGVNDAPALKKADVGVAMGGRGTDVAKEAAAVVLQDDRFATIAAAVEEGRVIFDNIRKFIFYLFSCNLAEVLLLFVAALLALPVPLLPLQLLWLNLLTDTVPALALAFEPAEARVMQRPPRDPRQAILSARFLGETAFYGTLIMLSSFFAFWAGSPTTGGDVARARTLAFVTLALAQTFHLGNARSLRQHVLAPRAATANRYAVGALIIVVTFQLIAVYWPALAQLLSVHPLSPSDWLLVTPLAIAPALVGQGIRWATERGRDR